LNTVIRGMDKLLQRVVGENIKLDLRLGEEVGHIKVDLSQLEQVIMNITVNARDAMPHGGSFMVRTEHLPPGSTSPGLDPSLSQVRSYTMLMVRDIGVGIAPEIQAHVFEPFFTTKERGKGTGLGLATVYAVVTQCQGTVALESALGRGTTFRLYFPCTDEPLSQIPIPALVRGSETILIVEDDDSLRNLLMKSLTKNGFKTLSAGTGDEAIQSFHKYPPIDLLITDVVLPQMSGREVAERLTSLRPEMKVLFMSGYAPDIISNQGVLDADAAFIAKPFTGEMLAQQVRELLGVHPPKSSLT
jgi:two-component system, cell cycle sensor histidine kinase and response regulator CckA